MSAHHFTVQTQFRWQGSWYVVQQCLPPHAIIIKDLATAAIRTVPFAELAQALFAGDLQFQSSGETPAEVDAGLQATFLDYPAALRAQAEYRLEVIRPLLALSPHARSRERVVARIAEMQHNQSSEPPIATLSVTSVYRWLRRYRQSGQDIRVLVDDPRRRGGKQQSRLDRTVEDIIHQVIQEHYYVAEQVTHEDIYLEVALQIAEVNEKRPPEAQLATPSRTTIWRRLGDQDPQAKLLAKRGVRQAQHAATQYEQLQYPQTPLARVEIDHTCLDLIVVDTEDQLPLGRPTLTYCLDTTTRYPLGFYLGFDPPSYLAVMECLHHAILTKPNVREKYGTQHEWLACGIPMRLMVDNGKEFIGQDLLAACQALGIELEQLPVKTPHFKATVERMFNTLNTGLLHTLPGTTFSDIQQRGEYASAKEACLTLADLDRVLHIFLLDVYAEGWHRGLGGIPARSWETHCQNGFFPRLPTSRAELKILLGRWAQRVIHPYGIEFMHLRYNTAELASLRLVLEGAQVQIKYDPADLGRIYVFDPRQEKYIGVDCLDLEYAQGLSVWQHRVIIKHARQEQEQVDMLSLARAKRQIRALVAHSKADKKLKSRSRVARWETGGQSVGREIDPTHITDAPPPPVLPAPALPQLPPSTSVTLLPPSVEPENDDWSADYDLPYHV